MAAVVGHAGGAWGGDPQTGYSSSCLLANPCAHLTVRLPHGTQRPLSAAVSHSPTSQTWVCWIHTGWTWARAHTGPLPSPETRGRVQPRTYHGHQVILNTSGATSCGCNRIQSRSSSTKSAAFRELQLRAYTLPASLAESCGVRAWAAECASFLQEKLGHLGHRRGSTVFSFVFPGPARTAGGRGGHLASRGRGDFLTGGWKEVVEAYELK